MIVKDSNESDWLYIIVSVRMHGQRAFDTSEPTSSGLTSSGSMESACIRFLFTS